MSLSKQFLSESTEPAFAPKAKLDFYQRISSMAPKIVMRPWVQNYMLSRSTQMVLDALIVMVSFVLAHVLRFDGWPPGMDGQRMIFALPYLVMLQLIVNNLMGLYRRIWRYVSIPDAIHLGNAVGLISVVLLALRLIIADNRSLWVFPIGTIFIDF